jgi:hypothetical protein
MASSNVSPDDRYRRTRAMKAAYPESVSLLLTISPLNPSLMFHQNDDPILDDERHVVSPVHK